MGCGDCVVVGLVFERCSELKGSHGIAVCLKKHQCLNTDVFCLGFFWLLFFFKKWAFYMKINALLYWTSFGKSLTPQKTGYCLTADEKRVREVELVTL